ncbi:hypothetical protein [Candidatus Palauibacter sp.]|uniref:hypothetical protein n=1 Tax=Candidatus Palauibacter sp. TaxID=3101350 RepID=UPI003B51B491
MELSAFRLLGYGYRGRGLGLSQQSASRNLGCAEEENAAHDAGQQPSESPSANGPALDQSRNVLGSVGYDANEKRSEREPKKAVGQDASDRLLHSGDNVSKS